MKEPALPVMWNPDVSPEHVRDRFCRYRYGKAAEAMKEYYRKLEDGIVNVQRACDTFGYLGSRGRAGGEEGVPGAAEAEELLIQPFAGLPEILIRAERTADSAFVRDAVRKQQLLLGY